MGVKADLPYMPEEEPDPRAHDCCGAHLAHRTDCQLIDRKRQRAYQNYKDRKALEHE